MSKELEALEKIKDSFGCDMAYYGLNVEYEIIKQSLLKAQENEKVLKILFEKGVDIVNLCQCVDLYTYNLLQRSCRLLELTQEEYKLLKRWLNEKDI